MWIGPGEAAPAHAPQATPPLRRPRLLAGGSGAGARAAATRALGLAFFAGLFVTRLGVRAFFVGLVVVVRAYAAPPAFHSFVADAFADMTGNNAVFVQPAQKRSSSSCSLGLLG